MLIPNNCSLCVPSTGLRFSEECTCSEVGFGEKKNIRQRQDAVFLVDSQSAGGYSWWVTLQADRTYVSKTSIMVMCYNCEVGSNDEVPRLEYSSGENYAVQQHLRELHCRNRNTVSGWTLLLFPLPLLLRVSLGHPTVRKYAVGIWLDTSPLPPGVPPAPVYLPLAAPSPSTPKRLPIWAIILIAVGALILVGGAITFFFVFRAKR